MVSLVPRDARVDRTDAVKKECVEELSMTDPRHWVRKLVLGIVCAILSSGLMLAMLLMRRSATRCGESRLGLRLALLLVIVFWLVLVLYIFLCVYAVLAFLANMSDKDTSDWVESWLQSLLWTLVLKPIFWGLLVATVFSCTLWFWPGLADKVKEKRQLPEPRSYPVLPVAGVKPVDRHHNVQQDVPPEGRPKEGRACQLDGIAARRPSGRACQLDGIAPRAPKQEVVMGCCWPANSEAAAASPLRHAVPASFEPDKDDSNFAEVLEPDFQGRGEAAVYCGNVLCSPSRKKVGEA